MIFTTITLDNSSHLFWRSSYVYCPCQKSDQSVIDNDLFISLATNILRSSRYYCPIGLTFCMDDKCVEAYKMNGVDGRRRSWWFFFFAICYRFLLRNFRPEISKLSFCRLTKVERQVTHRVHRLATRLRHHPFIL